VCANGGGTAAGQLAFSEVVFKAEGRSLRLVGIVTPRQPLGAEGAHVPLVSAVAIKRGRVIAPEYWYGPYDGSCCASGEAKTIWEYTNGKLRPSRTVILQRPWTSGLYIADVLAEPGDQELHGDRTTRIVVSPHLRFAVAIATYGRDKRHVSVRITIRQPSSTIVQTKTIDRISGDQLDPNVFFGNLPTLQLGTKATVTIDAHDAGARPLRYPVIFTRG
jgi:hypothetical protein